MTTAEEAEADVRGQLGGKIADREESAIAAAEEKIKKEGGLTSNDLLDLGLVRIDDAKLELPQDLTNEEVSKAMLRREAHRREQAARHGFPAGASWSEIENYVTKGKFTKR